MDVEILEQVFVESFGDIGLAAVECLRPLEWLPIGIQVRCQRFAHHFGDRAILLPGELLKLTLEGLSQENGGALHLWPWVDALDGRDVDEEAATAWRCGIAEQRVPATGRIVVGQRQVEAAIAKLPERQREAIVLCHYQELGNIEAAASMGVSVEALESLLGRGRRTMRVVLADLRE